MPNRILRDWTDSFIIDSLDVHAERFFTRLIMKVDDYGCFYANEKLLRSNLYPLKTDIRETDISRWLTACEKAGLITLYNVAAKKYLQINNFRQRLDRAKNKYPLPSEKSSISNDNESMSIDNEFPPETETESETETEIINIPVLTFEDFWNLYDYKKERPKCEAEFKKLNDEDLTKIKLVLPDYVKSTPDKKFRKYPIRWLKNKCWNDEVSVPEASKPERKLYIPEEENQW